MEDHLMDTPFTNKEPSTAPGKNFIEPLSPASLQPNPMCCEMGLPLFAAYCLRELDSYHQGEPCTDAYWP
jgi:hypothetical protein